MNKRGHLIRELVETQEKFALDMEQLEQAFKMNSTRLVPEDKYSLLGNLSEVVELSSQINRSWQKEYTKHPVAEADEALIAAKTLPFKDRINDVFFTYNSNYDADAVRKHAAMEAYVDEGLENLKMTKPNVLNISSELIKPVQRMFKYIQLFEKLQEHTPESHEDYQATTEMFESFAALARRVNEKKRWSEIRHEVFEGPTRKTGRSAILDMKPFPGLLTLKPLKKSTQLEIDAVLDEEKNRLQKLQNVIKSVRDWIKRWLDRTSKAYYSERNFLQCVLNMCDGERHLCIHPLVKSCSESYAAPVDEISAHISVLDSCLANLKRVYEPELGKVTNRLEQLLEVSNDPQLLLKKLCSVHEELKTVEKKLDEQNYANQSEAALVEAREELQHTKNTLQENLRKELPRLNKQIEDFLFTTVSYVQLVMAKMASKEVVSMRKAMERTRKSSAGKPTLDLVEWRNFIEHIGARIKNDQSKGTDMPIAGGGSRIARSSSTTRSGAVYNGTRHQGQLSRFNSSSAMPSGSVSYLSFSSTSYLPEGYSNYGRSTRVPVSPNCPYPGPSTSNFFPYDWNQSRSTSSFKPFEIEPTHQATHDYTAQDQNQISMKAGETVKVLETFDRTGNTQWYRVVALPDLKTGYVPSSYLRPL